MRKRQGPRLEVGGDDSLLGFKVRLEAPSAPEKASGHLAGGTLSHLLKGPRCRQRETDPQQPFTKGQPRTDIGEIRWQGSDTHRQPQTARGGRTQQGWGPRLIPASEGHSQTQVGGPRQTARAGSLYPPRQTKRDSQTPGSVQTAPPP